MNLQALLDKWNIKCDIQMILDMWNENNRYYHNQEHLTELIEQIKKDYSNLMFDEKTYDKLILTTLFHDIIYDVTKDNNEEKSADLFISMCLNKENSDIQDIKNAILDTKSHESKLPLSILFNNYDMSITDGNFDKLLKWEEGIYNEYKIFGNKDYKIGRLEFLNSLLNKKIDNSDNILKLIKYVEEKY